MTVVTSSATDAKTRAAPSGRSRGIHQFVPRLEPRDATGNHTLLVQQALRSAGWNSEIFVHEHLDATRHRAFLLEAFHAHSSSADVLVYQFSTASPIAEFLKLQPGRLVLNYHNLTPPELYQVWDLNIAQGLKDARRQLRTLAPRAILGIADSKFNAEDLMAAGCACTEVHPVLFDPNRDAGELDDATSRRLEAMRAEGGAQWLFVGRSVPPKAQHKLLMAFWVYRRLYDPQARLHLVGAGGHKPYVKAVKEFAEALSLDGAIHFVEDAEDRALATYYRRADVFTSLSEHEGFGIPLVEAMAGGIPVISLDAGAVPETVDGAGVVLSSSEPALMAAAVHRVMTDGQLRADLVAAGQKRAANFALVRTQKAISEAIINVAERPG